MMTLSEMIKNLQKLEAEGHGDKSVFYSHPTGDCGEFGRAFVSSEVGECGPFGITKGQEYICIEAGF
ncbi:hypothetical protein [Serratia sp. 1D1416]|uniref:hypothetical protein n=1 Tax=Serratia sp. 1D1416 TaxID=2447890 RepID=UPI001013D0A1|nr:hypothetical protein [Serratia sp. 1D1416]